MNSGDDSSTMFHSCGEVAASSAARVRSPKVGASVPWYSAFDNCGKAGASAAAPSARNRPALPPPIARAISKRVPIWPEPDHAASSIG
jgi:hypothetical protein